jgi:tetratricopeptide (TPR) repeat protein
MPENHWPALDLAPGVLREASLDGSLILWLRGEEAGGPYWIRLASVRGAAVTTEPGLQATPATAVRVRPRGVSLFGRLLQPFRKPDEAPVWLLPDGGVGEQMGERQSDVLLVWAGEAEAPLDAARVRGRWPSARLVQSLGKNLFLVGGATPQPVATETPLPLPGNPMQQGEALLVAARQAGDRGREVSALTDLGAACLTVGDGRRAAAYLQEALALARQIGDRAREMDVLANMGVGLLATSQARQAVEVLEATLALARGAGDVFAEKTALGHLGTARGLLCDHLRARADLEEALKLAREVGDRAHEAELLWDLAIVAADLDNREQAQALARSSIDLFTALKSPLVSTLAEHLERFRSGAALPAVPKGSAVTAGAAPAPAGAPSGPGLLRMAMSAGKSLLQFAGSGMKTAAPQTQNARLQTCAGCPHHTGVRCRLCGCFTAIKTKMPHESCPIGKWQAET